MRKIVTSSQHNAPGQRVSLLLERVTSDIPCVL